METNPNTVQENPAQIPLQPRYRSAEAEEIVGHLKTLLEPEYILLFGSLAGGTPHSDVTAYDLLVVVRETPAVEWLKAKRCLRYKMPLRRREITYINLYVMTVGYAETICTPFLYFAHSEGELLYCGDSYRFRRPKRPFDFAAAYADTKLHGDTFLALGREYLEQACREYNEKRNMRLAAIFSAQAAVYFYHTLYYVYHGLRFESHDPVIMHERLRTLSAPLMLALDDDHIENVFTLPYLKRSLLKGPYNVDFNVVPQELEVHMRRVAKMGEIVGRQCGARLALYKELSGK